MEQEFIICNCGHLEHMIVLAYDSDELEPEYQEMYLDVFLNPQYSFLKRVLSAIRYIFGYRSKYGHFDEIALGKEEVTRLKDFITQFEVNILHM